MKIKTKSEMNDLYLRGKLGNRLQVWTVGDYLASDYSARVGLRYLGSAGKSYPEYARPKTREEVIKLIDLWKSLGADENLINVNEVTYDYSQQYNCEIFRTENYLEVFYDDDPNISCREAMAKKGLRHLTGLSAVLFLKSAMGEEGYLDLEELFEEYPDGIIELTTFNQDVGILPRKNYCVWEIRTDY